MKICRTLKHITLLHSEKKSEFFMLVIFFLIFHRKIIDKFGKKNQKLWQPEFEVENC